MAKIGQGPSTPAMTFQDPMVDKLGNASCPSGLVLATQAGTGSQVCVDPATL